MINTMEVAPEELPGLDLFQNCRLCLAKEKVSVDIFSEGHEIRLLYYKIVSCLPVHVTQDDKLPRKICMQCNEKVDNFYQFWTLTAKSQKTLLDWVEKKDLLPPAKIKTENVPPGEVLFKQEVPDYSDEDNDNDNDRYEDDNSEEDLEPSTVVKVCEETEETAGGTTPGPSAGTKIKLRKKNKIQEHTENVNKEKSKICQFDLSLIKAKHKELSDRWECDQEEMTCKSCGFISDSLSNLFQHNDECKKFDKIFECSLCGKQCKMKKDMKQHMIVHLDERPYSCDICNWKFKRQFQLTKHNEIVHSKSKKEICKICGWVGKSKQKLALHRKTCTTNVYQCDICKKMFGAKSSLEYHLRAHSSERPFPCDICEARFKYKRNVHKHILYVHKGHKPVKKPENPDKIPLCQCEICGKSFYSRFGYSSHIKKIHGDEKPHCPICGKKLSCKKGLTIHMNTHTGEKPFCCEICGRSFTTKDYMKIHARIHTGESPYKCHICPKSFKQKGSLNGHYRTNHPGFTPVTS